MAENMTEKCVADNKYVTENAAEGLPNEIEESSGGGGVEHLSEEGGVYGSSPRHRFALQAIAPRDAEHVFLVGYSLRPAV